MGYLKITAYVYLAVAAFFTYEGIMALNSGEDSFIMFFFAAVAVFLFFFRMRNAKKFGNRREKEEN
ncbi:hypothetical protein DVK85_03580 [Flavobacterium arcticum]|uniref:Uncharacterized protein n=1 Tax=Flavobacterium arcticum TaxID=1784713 RepID=A0A345H9V0_9FLAO|nr:hypothetical protein [Flavobacterium arcticum]AXG73360.1 hypothetical protein DVK85_03580 [Flavobacterium arcticum]KAF2513153.1 hypothetical protein E0W72_01635 [Flavobacterium arcticum]